MDTRAHADQWLNAWAARDLDAIMACYCDTVDFAGPDHRDPLGRARRR